MMVISMKAANGLAFRLSRHVLWASLLAAVSHTQAVTFGIYDPRALAMGGATVALASPQHAQFYNPALMAFHDQRAEDSLSGRLYLPLFTLQTSDALIELEELDQDDLVSRTQTAIGAFNATPSMATAIQLRAEAADLESAVDALDHENLPLEAFAGLAIVEPDNRSGGAFHLGVRVVGGGVADITDSDRELLKQYLENLDFIISGGSAGRAGEPPHPELFTADGDIIDFTGDIDSTLSGRGAIIVEWGLSAAGEFTFFGHPVALGITPKLMEVRVYDDMASVARGDFNSLGDERSHLTGNVDVGMAVELNSGLRLGLAVKEVVSQTFSTNQGQQVHLRPRSRIGLAYVQPGYALGLDLDLIQNKPIGFEQPVQELALGGEVKFSHWAQLRFGYKYDLAQSHDDALSLGLGLRVYRFLVDVAYSHGDNNRGGGLQLGLAF